MDNDKKIDEILTLVRDERHLNNSRFVQLSTGMHEVDLRMSKVAKRIDEVETNLKQEIRQVFSTLSEDVQAFAGDLDKVRRRVDRLEKKIA